MNIISSNSKTFREIQDFSFKFQFLQNIRFKDEDGMEIDEDEANDDLARNKDSGIINWVASIRYDN